jgi:hypothetical protein
MLSGHEAALSGTGAWTGLNRVSRDEHLSSRARTVGGATAIERISSAFDVNP